MAPSPQNHPLAARRARARCGRLRAFGLRLLERLQGRRRGRTGEARRPPVQRRLLALPQPQRQRGLGLPRRPARTPRGPQLLRRLPRSPEQERRDRRRWPMPSRSPTPATRPSTRSRARASTRCPSAAKSNRRNRSRSSTRRPEQGPIEGSLVLFELPASASENRPLTLSIPGPEGPAAVTLDL